MLKEYANRLYRCQRGITGLETAIILIAFVVVASVFAYTVLSAGIFSSGKGTEAVHAGLETARSTMELVGNVKVGAKTATTIDNADAVWTASANVTASTTAIDVREGTGSAQMAVADLFSTGLVAFRNITAVNLSTHYTARLWVKSSTAQAAGVLRLVLDDTAGCGTPLETLSLSALAANTWTNPIVKLASPAALTAVACVGISALTDPGIVTINVDYVESPGEVDQVILVVGNSLGGEAVNLITTVDADNDGIISDEATKTHRISIDYADANQVVSDLAWTAILRGKGDSDNLLEAGEKFEISVSLKALNPLPVERTRFSLYLRPDKGSAVVIQRTVPVSVDTAMDLK